MQILTCASVQAGLDKMAQGHMLADVVAIIGENRVVFIVRKAEAVIKFHLSASFLSFSLCFFPSGTQDIVFGEVDR